MVKRRIESPCANFLLRSVLSAILLPFADIVMIGMNYIGRKSTQNWCEMGKKVVREIPSCKACGKEIVITRARDYNKEYCNHLCAGARNRRADKICIECGKSFHPKYTSQYLCSYECMGKRKTSGYVKICESCGNKFVLHNRAYERRGDGRFCSSSCGSRKYKVNERYFHDIDTPEKAYWLGFLFADGYQNGQEMIINLAVKDREHLVKLKSAMEAEHPIHDTHRVSFRIASTELCKDLNDHNCVQAKSLILGKPKGVPAAYVPDLIRRYFDGDGHVQKPEARGGGCSMHCAGDEFRNWVLNTLREAGVPAKNPKSQQGRNVSITSVQGVRLF